MAGKKRENLKADSALHFARRNLVRIRLDARADVGHGGRCDALGWKLLEWDKEDMVAQKMPLPPEARRGTHIPTGKGWRLPTPSGNRVHKASLLKTFAIGKERSSIFRVF